MGDDAPQSYDQVTLQVSLDLTQETATVMCRLQATRGQQSTKLGQWTISAEEFGLPSRLTKKETLGFPQIFRLPTELMTGVTEAIARISNFAGPLWIQLVKPYGYLGLAPWEEWLAQATRLPVLRLPETQTERPREVPGSLDMVICASAARADGPFELENYLPLMVDRVVQAVPQRRCRFHVFADYAATSRLQDSWAQKHMLDTVVWVHSPGPTTAPARPQRTGQNATAEFDAIENAWLLWIRDALRGQSVDVVHFVCHGYYAADQAALVFAESPLQNNDRSWSLLINAAELKTFLLQVGAWAAAVSSPVTNYSDLGSRAVADALAQQGPSAVLYHDWRNDPNAAQLAAGYGFLLQATPQVPPPTPALALVCQPYHVVAPRDDNDGFESNAPRALESSRHTSSLTTIFQESDTVPSWLASSARYVEQCQWELSRTLTGSEKPQVSGYAAQRAKGVKRALEQIERAVARVALRKKGT